MCFVVIYLQFEGRVEVYNMWLHGGEATFELNFCSKSLNF
jgi:hypothetical protein